jgi:hypothetical protein
MEKSVGKAKTVCPKVGFRNSSITPSLFSVFLLKTAVKMRKIYFRANFIAGKNKQRNFFWSHFTSQYLGFCVNKQFV